MRKAFLSAAMVLVAAIGMNGAAGAAPGQISAAPARLATQAAAATYLKSLGVNPATVVVQRGLKNYAGPNCPGADWNCTDAKQVLQVSSASGINSFTCTPAGGGTSSPNTCVIVQTSTTANNTAQCVIKRLAASGSALQSCSITQTSTSGKNKAEVKQEAALLGATTSATQTATVVQTSGSGSNTVSSTQASGEAMLSGSSSIGTWSQSASQSLNIDQTSGSGANSVDAWQLVGQAQTALKATAGSQSQTSNQLSTIDQSSGGAASVKVKQTEGQLQVAKTTGVTQTQVGPQRCCSSQIGTPATTTVTQQATQIQKPSNNQVQQQQVTYTSTGTITGTQTATQDGTTSTNTFSGSTVAEEQSCTDGECEIGEPEPPPPPDSWTAFSWTGGDGTTVDREPLRHQRRGTGGPQRDRCVLQGRPLHGVGRCDDARDDVGGRCGTRMYRAKSRGHDRIRLSRLPIRRTVMGRSRSTTGSTPSGSWPRLPRSEADPRSTASIR